MTATPASASRRGAFLLLGLLLLGLLPALSAAGAPARTQAHVYLLRGFLDLFSVGLDGIGEELRARGVNATVHNYAAWSSLAAEAAADYRAGSGRPVILIGHSAGGAAVVYMARRLNELGVPVALVVTLDPPGGEVMGGQVRQAVNLFFGTRSPMRAAEGFAGALTNLNISGIGGIDHMNVDDHPEIHRIIIDYVLKAAASR